MRGTVCGWLSLGILALFTACGMEGIAWEGTRDNVHQSFNVSQGGLLTVDADMGSIEVRTSSDNRVDVEVMRNVNAQSPERAAELFKEIEIRMNQSGNNVDVRARIPHAEWWHKGRNFRLEFVITVPRVYNVDLKTSGGGITVSDLEGKVNGKTSGGGLAFGNIRGPVFGRTSGGGVKLDSCVGNADVETSGGSITLGDVDGEVSAVTSGGSIDLSRAKGRVKVETSGGSIRVDEVQGAIEASTSGGGIDARITEQPQADCRLETSGGNVEVELAENVRANLDAKTSGGHVRTEFPITVTGEVDKNNIQGPINGGGPALILRTSGGSINIRKTGSK